MICPLKTWYSTQTKYQSHIEKIVDFIYGPREIFGDISAGVGLQYFAYSMFAQVMHVTVELVSLQTGAYVHVCTQRGF